MIRLQLTKWFAVGVTCAVLAACAPPFARLDGILVQNRPALPEEFGRLQVIRGGETRDGAPGMRIQKGDTIITAADGVAVLTLKAGWQVIFEPGTVAEIQNPSIFLKIGKLFISKIKEAVDALKVNSEFVSAGVEGTTFVFEVTRDSSVQIAVLDGRVVVHSRLARWDSTTYEAGETGMINARSAPSPRTKLDPATVRDIRTHIREVEQRVRPAVPNVNGLTEPAARDALATAGLRVGGTLKVITRRVPAGIVVATIPPAGNRVRAGDRITLQVEDSSLVVPQLIGLTLAQAVEVLRRAGFDPPDTASTVSRNARVGTVVAATPAVGGVVSAATRIRLTVARQMPVGIAVPVDTTRMTRPCTVPDLMSKTEDVARQILTRVKLQLGKVNRLRYGTLVTRQNPSAGTTVSCGSRVDIDIGTNIEE